MKKTVTLKIRCVLNLNLSFFIFNIKKLFDIMCDYTENLILKMNWFA